MESCGCRLAPAASQGQHGLARTAPGGGCAGSSSHHKPVRPGPDSLEHTIPWVDPAHSRGRQAVGRLTRGGGWGRVRRSGTACAAGLCRPAHRPHLNSCPETMVRDVSLLVLGLSSPVPRAAAAAMLPVALKAALPRARGSCHKALQARRKRCRPAAGRLAQRPENGVCERWTGRPHPGAVRGGLDSCVWQARAIGCRLRHRLQRRTQGRQRRAAGAAGVGGRRPADAVAVAERVGPAGRTPRPAGRPAGRRGDRSPPETFSPTR